MLWEYYSLIPNHSKNRSSSNHFRDLLRRGLLREANLLSKKAEANTDSVRLCHCCQGHLDWRWGIFSSLLCMHGSPLVLSLLAHPSRIFQETLRYYSRSSAITVSHGAAQNTSKPYCRSTSRVEGLGEIFALVVRQLGDPGQEDLGPSPRRAWKSDAGSEMAWHFNPRAWLRPASWLAWPCLSHHLSMFDTFAYLCLVHPGPLEIFWNQLRHDHENKNETACFHISAPAQSFHKSQFVLKLTGKVMYTEEHATVMCTNLRS